MNTTTSIPNFRQIKSFLALARHLSFTRAAEELGISQPTLTVQIHQLEETLSVILFDRNRRQVRLTDVGRNLLEPLEQLLTDLDAVMNFSNDRAQLRSGTVRIAAMPSISSSLIPKTIRIFQEKYPGVSVQIYDIDAEQIIEMVKLEQVDFGVGMKVLPDREIIIDEFLTEQLCVFFPEDHPLQSKKSGKITLKDCTEFPLILTNRSSSLRKMIDRELIESGLEVQIAQEANFMATALAMTRANIGITILPNSAIGNGSTKGLDYAPVHSPHLYRKIGIVQKQNKRLSPSASYFLKDLNAVAQENKMFTENKNKNS
ncbi:LysR family transcriptional regulator [Microvirga sp. W0021]|uniref:LysR family transcriptional regulator n=1 Tax=Hohaiivirga grylli TaxID=3133970 RepID=A0ABV0BIX0_9HYPH